MKKMIVLMILSERNQDYLIYKYGYDRNSLDGKIKIYFNKEKPPEVLKLTQDKRVGEGGTFRALGKLLKMIRSGEVKEVISYQS